MTDRKPYRHRFPLSVIGDALRLSHRFPLSQRDVQELLHERGIQVSHKTLRQWNIKFAPLLTKELRHGETRRVSPWHLDEVCVKVGGVGDWLWRAVDERGDVLDILLQEHRDTEVAKSFFVRLLKIYEVPEVIHIDKLWNSVEQSHRPTRRQERQQRGFRSRKRAQGFLDLHARMTNVHHPARSTLPAHYRRHHQRAGFSVWQEVVQQAACTLH
ncbi:IS6 family transposase [Deinococcus oregonensis]|uniref:IS6 family transposase n=1 Tax=Deinococcus oregonensis TaxID=1805970 RepID=A0ABV6ATK5_9DEIO